MIKWNNIEKHEPPPCFVLVSHMQNDEVLCVGLARWHFQDKKWESVCKQDESIPMASLSTSREIPSESITHWASFDKLMGERKDKSFIHQLLFKKD